MPGDIVHRRYQCQIADYQIQQLENACCIPRDGVAIPPLPDVTLARGVNFLSLIFETTPTTIILLALVSSYYVLIQVPTMMQLGVTFLTFGLVSWVSGQNVGADGITTVLTATCTATGTQTYAFVDTAGSTYQYMCGGGSGGTAITTIPSASVTGGWQACFTFCDAASGCSGFSYVSQKTVDIIWQLTEIVPVVARCSTDLAD